SGELWTYLWPSLVVLAIGFAFAVVFGIGIGLLLARFWVLDVALTVYITFLYSIPGRACSADRAVGGVRHHGQGHHPLPVRVFPDGDQYLPRRQKRRSKAARSRSRLSLLRGPVVVEYRAAGVASVHRDGTAAGARARADRHGARRSLYCDFRDRLPDRAHREHLSGGQDVRADRGARALGRDFDGATAPGREIRSALDRRLATGLNHCARQRRR